MMMVVENERCGIEGSVCGCGKLTRKVAEGC